MKFNELENEIGRILKNCSVNLQCSDVAAHVSYFMQRMQFSGYDKTFRFMVLNKSLKLYDKKRETGSMFKEHPPVEGENKRKNNFEWYKKQGRFDTVMFVEATPGSELKRKVQEAAKRNKIKVKVVERVSSTIRGLIQKSNPFKIMKCERADCVVCKLDSNFDCRTRGCVYKIKCKECKREYKGQTGRSTYERTCEHIDDWEKGRDRCPLLKHSLQYHGGKKFEYEVKIEALCFGKPTKRLITEAVVIDELETDKAMNNKGEWSYTKLTKVKVV